MLLKQEIIDTNERKNVANTYAQAQSLFAI